LIETAPSSAAFVSASTAALKPETSPKVFSATSLAIYAQNVSGTYSYQTAPSATIPHTWATGDQIIIKTARLAA